MNNFVNKLFFSKKSIAPLVVFRILFGVATLFSTSRFLILGWVNLHFVATKVQFKYDGFEWVKLLPESYMYFIHFLMIIASIGIIFGAFYRICAVLFFLCFTYCELIDITYYLNHYYFVSLISFLMCFVPANAFYSIDAWKNKNIEQKTVPNWCILIFKFQLLIVYFFAGIAKINYDWLINALPLKIWLPANNNLPIIGSLFNHSFTAHVFSWAGMLFDIFIGLFLLNKLTRFWAWLLVIFFHVITGIMFQIGVFPLVMVASTLIFFSTEFHLKCIHYLKKVFHLKNGTVTTKNSNKYFPLIRFKNNLITTIFLFAWMLFHLLFPLRYIFYKGNIFWTEEAYRFSWRVMLMEKAGTATFYVLEDQTKKEGVVDNTEFLNPHQEKQMAMQPDLILQYAQFLKNHYKNKGLKVSKIRADVYVTLNARPSKLLIDTQQNLLEITDSWKPKNWILPFDEN